MGASSRKRKSADWRIVDRMLESRAVVEDHAGEGPIAFPELHDSLRRLPGVAETEAVELARAVLREYWTSGRIAIHLGRALDSDLSQVSSAHAVSLIENGARYRYGDGGEVRAWFSLSPEGAQGGRARRPP